VGRLIFERHQPGQVNVVVAGLQLELEEAPSPGGDSWKHGAGQNKKRPPELYALTLFELLIDPRVAPD